MCAVRAAPVSCVNEKLTTPPATLPMVSQVWSLLGANTPVSDVLAGSTVARAPLPAAIPRLTAPLETKARDRSSIL